MLTPPTSTKSVIFWLADVNSPHFGGVHGIEKGGHAGPPFIQCAPGCDQKITPNSSRPRTCDFSVPAAPNAAPGVMPDTDTNDTSGRMKKRSKV